MFFSYDLPQLVERLVGVSIGLDHLEDDVNRQRG